MVGRKLTRDVNARLGGVCAGVARYFGIDPIVARILVVAGTLLTGGLLAVAYVALIFVLPKSSVSGDVFDVRPERAVLRKRAANLCGGRPFAPETAALVPLSAKFVLVQFKIENKNYQVR